ncbi:hypothetical protein [Leptospira mayottensis]|nr:hypothetical protein [Leptospira mayottensis]
MKEEPAFEGKFFSGTLVYKRRLEFTFQYVILKLDWLKIVIQSKN